MSSLDLATRQLRLYPKVEDARDGAMDDATATGGRVFPCIVFNQGDRMMISTSVPYSFLRRHIRQDWVGLDGDKGVREATNRPLMPDHVRNIKSYILDNEDHYIMPPVTLNVREVPRLYVHDTPAPTRLGFLVVDDDTKYYVTDGQHRIAAIAGHNASRKPTPGVLDEDDAFARHGIAVQLIYEPDLASVHQDFADAAQTKTIPASLLASYNMREPINRVLNEIVDRTFLSGRIDESSKTLSKNSNKFFLLNQVRGFVKELLVRDYAKAEPALLHAAHDLIGTRETQDRFIANAVLLLDTLADSMVPWNELADPAAQWLGSNQVAARREHYINMTATGLVIIGRVGHDVIARFPDESERRRQYERLATAIDWQRDAPIWQDGIVQHGKIMTQRGPVSVSANRVLDSLGLDASA